VVDTSEGRKLTGSIDIDNYGNKYTGAVRYGATLNANDLSGHGEQITGRVMSSGSGLLYGRLGLTVPVGPHGTKVGAAVSALKYELGKDFAPLRAEGTADVGSLYVAHPFVRSRNANLYGVASYDKKSLADEQLGQNVTDKDIDVFSVGVFGDLRDGIGGGGINSASLTLVTGKLGLGGNAVYAATDAITARTGGSRYNKVAFSLARLQRMSDSWNLYVAFSGQTADSNLDSSEKFVLGGLGVRAYPQGEAAADSGTLLNIEARFAVPNVQSGQLQLVGFIDTGRVRLHKDKWVGWQPIGRPNFPGTYSLSGAGIGANFQHPSGLTLRASVAWKVGSNPGADALGRDSDNASRSPRLWIQAIKQF